MNSSMIGKIEKAHRYAREPERVRFNTLQAVVHGDNDDYRVTLDERGWTCTCHTFESHTLGTCSHIMALQIMLGDSLSEDARVATELVEA